MDDQANKRSTLLFQIGEEDSPYHRPREEGPPVTHAVCGDSRRTFYVRFIGEDELPADAVKCRRCERFKDSR
jgi:hypothetical protein